MNTDPAGHKSVNITTNTTTFISVPGNISGGQLVLIALVVNKKGGSGSTVAIYDSNAIIGANSDVENGSSRLKATVDATDRVGTLSYGFPMYNGIYVVSGGGTIGDYTIVYKELL